MKRLVSILSIVMLLGACSGGHEEVEVAAITPPLPPTPRLASMENFRDVAGADAASNYRSVNGHKLRRGVFYRSNTVAPDDADFKVLHGLGIGAVYDLRTPGEIAKAPDRLPPEATYVHINILGVDDPPFPRFANAEEAAQMLENLERQMVTDAAFRARLSELLRQMASTEGAQLFHCTAGKDRTGWVAALLQTIAGVPEEVIVADYLLTNSYTQKQMETLRQAVLQEHGAEMAEIITPILGVQERFLRAGFEQAQKDYGSLQNYITEGLELDTQVIAALREKLLESP